MDIKIQALENGSYETILYTDRYNYFKIIQALENDTAESFRAVDANGLIIYKSK